MPDFLLPDPSAGLPGLPGLKVPLTLDLAIGFFSPS